MHINFKKIDLKAKIPYKKYNQDACFDLYALNNGIEKENYIQYYTGIAIDIPKGYVGLVYPRSSITKMDLMLKNSVGVIDSGYQDEIIFRFQKFGNNIYQKGDRIGQIMIVPIPQIELNEVNEFENKSERGKGKFGSTGK